MADISDLDDDLIQAICAGLPLKTVFRLRPVSQRFNNLLSHHNLVQALNTARLPINTTPAYLLRLRSSCAFDHGSAVSCMDRIVVCDMDGNLCKDMLLQPRRDDCWPRWSRMLAVSSNGLYSIAVRSGEEEETKTFVCNPSSGGTHELPPFPGDKKPGDHNHYAMGFNARTSEFSFIRLSAEPSVSDQGYVFVVELHTNDNSWTETVFPITCHSVNIMFSPLFSTATGCYYWICQIRDAESMRNHLHDIKMIRFDTRDCSFTSFDLPDCPCSVTDGDDKEDEKWRSNWYGNRRCRYRWKSWICDWFKFVCSDGHVIVVNAKISIRDGRSGVTSLRGCWRLLENPHGPSSCNATWEPYQHVCLQVVNDYCKDVPLPRSKFTLNSKDVAMWPDCKAWNGDCLRMYNSKGEIASRFSKATMRGVFPPPSRPRYPSNEYIVGCWTFERSNIRWPWPSRSSVVDARDFV